MVVSDGGGQDGVSPLWLTGDGEAITLQKRYKGGLTRAHYSGPESFKYYTNTRINIMSAGDHRLFYTVGRKPVVVHDREN